MQGASAQGSSNAGGSSSGGASQPETRAPTTGESVRWAAQGWIDDQAAAGKGGQAFIHFLADDAINAVASALDGKFKPAAKSLAMTLVFRRLEALNKLRGATIEEARALIPEGWVESAAASGRGVRFSNPERNGEQIRIMFGNPRDPLPVKQGPYARVSMDGLKSDPIPLSGNPDL